MPASTGSDQASHGESGEKARPRTSPSAPRASSRIVALARRPAPAAGRRGRPSRPGEPSGAQASSSTRPISPAPKRCGSGASGAVGSSGPIRSASSPSASSTQAARSSPSSRGSRARTPGAACSVRAGPSAVRQPVHGAAHLEHAGAPGLVRLHVGDVVRGARPVRRPGGARAAQPDVQRTRLRVGFQRIEQPQLAGTLVDHPGAVGGGVPGVELPASRHAVVGVPPQLGAVRRQRVHVAPALVVGQERDAHPGPGPTSIGESRLPSSSAPIRTNSPPPPASHHSFPAVPPR